MKTEQLKRRGYEVHYDPYSHRGQWYVADSGYRRVTESYATVQSAWRSACAKIAKQEARA